MLNKLKVIDRKNLPLNFNILMPFIVYTMIDYWKLPIWVFATYMTLYVIVFILCMVVTVNTEKVDIFKK